MNKEPSQRQLRVGEQLRHIISDTLRRGHFHTKELLNMADISVTEVTTSPDLKNATAYIISMTGKDTSALIDALNNESSTFQKDIGRNTNLKFTPRLRFKTDKSYNEARKIDQILAEIKTSE